jgi:aspartate-semialdehyde dehydrogenase
VKVQRLDRFDFSQARIGLFSAGGALSAEFAPKAAAAGCTVVDNTSHFRYDADVPLIVPEVNAHRLSDYKHRNIIANPNCSTIQMVVALKPLHDAARITRINVATYQAVSGAGAGGVRELAGQTINLLNQGDRTRQDAEADRLQRHSPHRRVPGQRLHQGRDEDGVGDPEDPGRRRHTGESDLRAHPGVYGHSEAVHIETEKKVTAAEARELLAAAPGVTVIDDPAHDGYPTAVTDAAGTDPVFVGRIREDISHPRGLDLWVVSDNVRKGAALNSVQIAELLLKVL